jgi:hypothetical protein
MNTLRSYSLVSILLCILLLPALAQVNAPQPATNEPSKQHEEKQEHRILGVLPPFSLTNPQNTNPLTPREKFKSFRRSAFGPLEFGLVAIQAGIGQATDEFPEFGQGAAGYAKRYGSAFTDQASSSFFSDFLYPTLLKQDPRYFRSGHGSFTHRFGYALEQELVAHNDRGGRSFHFSNVFGAISAGALANAYHPPSDRGFGLTMSRAGIALAYGSLGGVLDEFYPDAMNWVFSRRKKKAHEQALQK